MQHVITGYQLAKYFLKKTLLVDGDRTRINHIAVSKPGVYSTEQRTAEQQLQNEQVVSVSQYERSPW